MRHEALPFLLPALQTLPPLLSDLYGELGFIEQRRRAEARFLRQAVPAVRYTNYMLAPHLQAQLSPWLREMADSPPLAAEVAERVAGGAPAAIQEGLLWAYAFEAGTRLSAAANGGGRTGETRDMRALFVPLVCETPNWSPALPSTLAEGLAGILHTRGLLHPDEVALVAPLSLPPRTVTRLGPLAQLIDFALSGAQGAWGEASRPAPGMRQRWEAWWRRPGAPHGVSTLRPLEVRLALLVAISPEPGHAVLDELLPWQEEARTRLLLSDRFDGGSLLELDSATELGEHTQSALEDWVELLNGRLEDEGIAVAVAGPPSDAYTACGRGATEAAYQFVLAQGLGEEEDTPVFLIADAAGLAVELGGGSFRLPWAPVGSLMPAMLPPLEEVVHAASGRRLERSTGEDLNDLVLIGRELVGER